ncbi:hypothetical protein COU78_03870 [Candidatus Peregrinibacteria bacterium CG10_big_fil_rev_8_21_14_0_10_49_24]|nr:MAG: hypothetical protein COV83_00490 [Candidatus Peregrinibacteria bacterium CG11_big_fil_rev_8_21_14_0_20_49_14]PIR50911.1 MAG: hypothetical protein COU78_03870 [Candidatus Peregrinibacteria bacterium CG10_big_fil_rev_8_21_14_0_10_49_24]PJA67336.1 MAG: hypothetical protein CO157_05085 [Candidatus Peregrinibacteria bacterium CG_4_9_14_3_um_filter_49_12]
MKRTVFLLCSLALLVSCNPPEENLAQKELPLRNITLVSGNRKLSIRAEIARNDTQRTLGLMYRTELAKGKGMLFVFEQETPMSFWMKNTRIPLDIIYFDSQGNFVSTLTMNPCLWDPCPLYDSAGPAQYVLEIPAGTVREHGIDSTWMLEL